MEIKRREILFSVIIIFAMLSAGVWISNVIQWSVTRTAEIYATSAIIRNAEQFRYGMHTNFGNALIYGTATSDESVTFEEIRSGFLYIEKVREDYCMHTRTETYTVNGKPRTRTVTYWTWDRKESVEKNVERISFLGEEFPFDAIRLSDSRLDLDSVGVSNRGNYIYETSHRRYYYRVTPQEVTGTLFANLNNGTISNQSALYENQTPEQVISDKQNAGTGAAVLFWIIWVVVIGICVYAFVRFENRWLD